MHVSTWPGQISLPKPQSSQMGFSVGGVDRLGKERIAPVNHPLPKPEQAFGFAFNISSVAALTILHICILFWSAVITNADVRDCRCCYCNFPPRGVAMALPVSYSGACSQACGTVERRK